MTTAHHACHVPYGCSHATRPINGLGTAGFVVSVAALVLSFGLLSPIGLLMSLIALKRAPRGLAFAGVVIGLVGSWWLILIGVLLLGALGVGAAAVAEHAGEAARENALERGRALLETTSAHVEARELREDRLLAFHEIRSMLGDVEDPWGSALRLELDEGRARLLRSAGADERFGTSDDLVRELAFPR